MVICKEQNMYTIGIKAAIAEIKNGKMIILVDDEKRESDMYSLIKNFLIIYGSF